MKKTHLGYGVLSLFVAVVLLAFLVHVESVTDPGDASVMFSLKKRLNSPENLGWSGIDPCQWKLVTCSVGNRVTGIHIGWQNLAGTLPPDLGQLTALERLELQRNQISGAVPSLTGLSSLQVVRLRNNNFTSISADFFFGLSSLQAIELDYNPFTAWHIPDSLTNAVTLQNFSANSANVFGTIPDFFGVAFPDLTQLHLAFNNLEGTLPATFAGSSMKSLWLNSNAFTGQLPDLSGLTSLQDFNIRDNKFTGPVPPSLPSLRALKIVNLTNNLLQGPMPTFDHSVAVDMSTGTNRFCLPTPGSCEPLVNTFLSIAKSMDYPARLADDWRGNDPCASWIGITCDKDRNIVVINFQKMGLLGNISPDYSSFKSLRELILAQNNLTGSIPAELATLPALTLLDLSNNQLFGKVPNFRSNVNVIVDGNPDIWKNVGSYPVPGIPIADSPDPVSDNNSVTVAKSSNGSKKSRVSFGVLVGCVVGGILLLVLLGFCLYKIIQQRLLRRMPIPNTMVTNPCHSGLNHEMQDGKMVISIQVLRNATNNFSDENILGKGGFGTVYKGELHDGMKIAIKRMESGVISGKGLSEIKYEIAVLTKVRHRNLVALLGYCLDGNERLLVYEYMPQGTLSRHLFNWKEEGLKPLEWTNRLTIALDVARGVEYLHGLAHQSFIHRDLKPSNILLRDDMRAKVADFGLVRLVPDGKGSVETRLAGTFGYLAPEYAVTGRVTTKVDVFSFGVILLELITGRKALDESQSVDDMHIVTWFQSMNINKDTFYKAIDPTIDLTEETLASISTIAELADHCCATKPSQRPKMGHAVNVLSSLVEFWKPTDSDSEDWLTFEDEHSN